MRKLNANRCSFKLVNVNVAYSPRAGPNPYAVQIGRQKMVANWFRLRTPFQRGALFQHPLDLPPVMFGMDGIRPEYSVGTQALIHKAVSQGSRAPKRSMTAKGHGGEENGATNAHTKAARLGGLCTHVRPL